MRGEIAGRYVFRRELGTGGITYEALDRVTGRRVAVTLPPFPPHAMAGGAGLAARIRQGTKAAARLNHPNILAILDQGEESGRAWLVTELVPGQALDRLMERGRIPGPLAVDIVLQVLDALAYAHAMGVVHRALGPAQVLLTPGQAVKVTGFGLYPETRVAGPQGRDPLAAMPERRRAERLDHRADIWAVGAMLRWMLAGSRPVGDPVSAALPSAARPFDAVLAKALAEFPEDRFASASEFASALRVAAQSAYPGRPHVPIGEVAIEMEDHAEASVTPASLERSERWQRPPLSSPPQPAPAAMRVRARRSRGLVLFVATALTAGGLAAFLSHRQPDGVGRMGPQQAEPTPEAPRDAPAIPSPALSALASAIPARLACSLVSTTVTDGVLAIAGVVQRADQVVLQQLLERDQVPEGATRLSITAFDGPYCPVLAALREALPQPAAGPRVNLLSPVPLPFGRGLRFSVAAPEGWPAVHLAVSYLTVEGFVGHLVGAEMAAGTTVTFADPSWQAGAPAGTDLMLVIATDRPLFPPRADRPRVERIPEFAASLGATLRRAQEGGMRVAVRAVAVPVVAP